MNDKTCWWATASDDEKRALASAMLDNAIVSHARGEADAKLMDVVLEIVRNLKREVKSASAKELADGCEQLLADALAIERPAMDFAKARAMIEGEPC